MALSADYLLQGKAPYTELNGKFACLVCRRQFGSEEKLMQHVNLSQLHRDCLAKAKDEAKIEYIGDGAKEAAGGSDKPKLESSASDALSAILGASSKLEQQIKVRLLTTLIGLGVLYRYTALMKPSTFIQFRT